MKLIIADATPLILMAKLDLLNVFCDHFNVAISSTVALEATCRDNLADARYIQKLIDDRRIQVKGTDFRNTSTLQKQWGIGKGEAEILTLALSEQAVIITDDFAVIRVAKTMSLKFTTTPMMIVELQRQKLLSMELARSKLTELDRHAWINPQILNRVKQILQEGGN